MYKKTELPNGMRLVTHHLKDRKSIGLGFLVGAGGRYEDDHVKGAAHFLEHILFKGSKKYSCNDIKEQVEGIGGSLNAFTTEEQTCYYAKIPSKHIKKTFDVLSDMVFSPLIAKDDVNKERSVILEEIKMYHDLPQYYVMELLDQLMWPNHPLGKNLAGSPESVGSIQHWDLKKFHESYYIAPNVVISACGDLKHEVIEKLAHAKLKNIGNVESIGPIKAKNTQSKAKVNVFRKNTEQMHMALGMFGIHEGHKDRYVMNLLNIILGGNMSSRLFNEVREKRGLAYSISSGVKSLKDTGMFMIRAGVDNRKLIDALDVILKELRKIRKKGVDPGEFKRAKEYYLGQVLLGLEDPLDHMLWMGESVLSRNKTRTLKEVISKVNKVKARDIRRLAGEILVEKQYNLAIVGPVNDSQEKKIRSLLKC